MEPWNIPTRAVFTHLARCDNNATMLMHWRIMQITHRKRDPRNNEQR